MEARTSSPEPLITDSRSPSVTDTSSEQEAIASKEKTLDSPASKERALDSPLSQSPAHTTRGGRIKREFHIYNHVLNLVPSMYLIRFCTVRPTVHLNCYYWALLM